MTIELPASVEQELREVSARQGRGLEIIVEEAVRRYLEAEAITDLGPDDIAATQLALAAELGDGVGWEPGSP
jgi:predicted transcriptional regulator